MVVGRPVGVIAARPTFAVIGPRRRPSHTDHRGHGGHLAADIAADIAAASAALRPCADADADAMDHDDTGKDGSRRHR